MEQTYYTLQRNALSFERTFKESTNKFHKFSCTIQSLTFLPTQCNLKGFLVYLKKRFNVIKSLNEPKFKVKIHKEIVIACCILQNYLKGVNLDEDIIFKVDTELANDNNPQEESYVGRDNNKDTTLGEFLRDSISANIWINYIN